MNSPTPCVMTKDEQKQFVRAYVNQCLAPIFAAIDADKTNDFCGVHLKILVEIAMRFKFTSKHYTAARKLVENRDTVENIT